MPDFAETSGRGKRREFSERNLFEFAVALAIREVEAPVATTAFVVRLLRSFERATAKLVPGFALPGALAKHGLHLGLQLLDGRSVVFEARGKPLRKPLILAAPTPSAAGNAARPRVERLDELPTDFDARIDVNLSRIAQRIASGTLPE